MKILKILSFALLLIIGLFSCKKEYSYENGKLNSINGTWQFENSGIQYIGDMDSASIQNGNGFKVLTLAGLSLGQETFRIRLYTPDSFTTTTYKASLSENNFDYFTSSKTLFKGDFSSGEFVVTITSLSGSIITGTFSGQVEDSTGAQTQITLGSFTSLIDLTNNSNGQGGTPSVGTLGANPDTCTSVIVSGNYTTGLPLSAINTVQVQVNVTTPGTFIIASNLVNGINFFKAGTFTNTGVQNVILTGTGTPQSEGVKYFTVTYGAGSSCIFAITFLPGITPIGDYFPTTIGSKWAYGLEGGIPTDSLLTQVISHAPTFGGNIYSSFLSENIPPSGFIDTTFFRKSGRDYFNYADLQDYFTFDDPVPVQYVFLNDSVPEGTIIKSADFTGTISGIQITGYVQITISEKAVPATVGTLNFSDVIKVDYEYFQKTSLGNSVPVASEERWFARGVGLIYLDDLYGDIYNIGRSTVL
ncbi:MAG: hypothetical protein ABIN97_01475 [Ginsengibacter sp.]